MNTNSIFDLAFTKPIKILQPDAAEIDHFSEP